MRLTLKGMTRLDKLALLFNIRPGEGRLVGLLLLHSFLIEIPTLFIGTASYALFLSKFGAEALPYLYISNALILPGVGFIYAKLEGRLSFAQLLLANLGFMLGMTIIFRLGLSLSQGSWLLLAFAVFYEVNRVLSNLEFWGLSGRLYDVRQGKRLFGLIASAGMVAAMIGGLLTPLLVEWLGLVNLLFLAAAGLLGALLSLIYITRLYAGPLTAAPLESADQTNKPQATAISLKNRFIILLISLTVVSILSYYFIDNAFYDLAETRYPGETELAGFIGIFGAMSSFITLVSQIFLTGWLVSRYGLLAGLLILPLADAVGIAAIAIAGTSFGPGVLVFWLMVITKLIDESWSMAIQLPVMQILYQPLPPQQRLRAQTIIESAIQPLANGAAGLALLFLSAGAVQLAYAVLFILAAWITLALLLGREYPLRLRQALTKRSLNGAAMTRPDRSSLAVLEQGLTSPQASVVIYTLDLLEEVAPDMLPTALLPLLNHRAGEVRLEALQRIERLNVTSVLPTVRKRIKYEGSVRVRGASLRVLAALGDAEALEEVYPYLEDADARLRQGAMVGLLRSGDLAGILAAGEMLNQLVNSADPARRQFAAQALGEAGITSFYRPLVKLLQDEALPVQRAAVVAAGKVKHPALWPFVVKSLASAKVRTAGMTALVAGGEAVLPQLSVAFGKNGSGPEGLPGSLFAGQERGVMIRLARICGRIGGAKAVVLLHSHLNFPDTEVRTQVLLALSRCGYQAEVEAQPAIHQEISAEVAGAAWTLAALLDLTEEPRLAGQPAVSLLTAALNQTLAQHRKRLFLWLSFIYDPRLIRQVQDNLNQALTEKKSYALEIMDVRVAPALKTLLMPVFDDLAPAQQLQHLNGTFPQPRLDYKMRLGDIIARPAAWLTPWPQACALYVMAQLSAAELAEAVIPALSAPDPLVRETAAWTLSRLDPALFERHRPGLRVDPSPQVVRAIKQLETMPPGEGAMIATVEKIIRLKSMDLFAETEEEVLADVAAILEELEVAAGETFLQKGDVGSSLYIIIEGRVSVHEGERKLAELGENDIFGELALLDPAPRSAAVTALADTRLFRLDQEPFYELLEDHTEVARKMLQILARRLRRTSEQTPPGRELINDLLDGLQEKLARSGRQG
jgi:AAA family ATP:ADP antiporter